MTWTERKIDSLIFVLGLCQLPYPRALVSLHLLPALSSEIDRLLRYALGVTRKRRGKPPEQLRPAGLVLAGKFLAAGLPVDFDLSKTIVDGLIELAIRDQRPGSLEAWQALGRIREGSYYSKLVLEELVSGDTTDDRNRGLALDGLVRLGAIGTLFEIVDGRSASHDRIRAAAASALVKLGRGWQAARNVSGVGAAHRPSLEARVLLWHARRKVELGLLDQAARDILRDVINPALIWQMEMEPSVLQTAVAALIRIGRPKVLVTLVREHIERVDRASNPFRSEDCLRMVEVILDKGDREDLRSLLLYLGETNLLPGIPQRVRDKLIERGWSAPEDSE